MKFVKLFKEFYNHANFLAGGQVTTGDSSNTAGIASNTAAGAAGKVPRKDGPSSFGPDMEQYDDIVKSLNNERRKKKRKRKKISRNQQSNKDNSEEKQ